MALSKSITQSDGVVTNYHRILFVQTTVNKQNSIVVLSYLNDAARESEKVNVDSPLYCRSVTYETEYAENMTVSAAYDYLKTLPLFEGAEDI